MNAVRKSHKQDSRLPRERGQAHNPDNGIIPSGFSDRLRAALAGRVSAEVARSIGIPAQTLDGYKKGAIPSADRALALADQLGVEYRWLIAGVGQQATSAPVATVPNTVVLDRFDPFSFGEFGKGDPIEQIAVPRWLMTSIKQKSGLWVCEMPSNALPDVAAEGEMIVCRDPDVPLQDRRVYIFMIEGRPVVRRVFVKPEGLQLSGESADDTILFRPEDAEHVIAMGRVLAAISLNQV